jgi:hypothetical protein
MILDTAYAKWPDVPLERTQLIVALDYPRWFSLQRLVRRSATRVVTGRLACNGNRETWRKVFSRDSIMVWHFKSFTRQRQRIHGWADDPTGPPVLRFTSQRQTHEG